MAFILPGVLFLMLGTGNLLMLTYATASLHGATEQAARYASVTSAATGSSPSSSTVSAYASNIYRGPALGQTFSYSSAGSCGTGGTNGNQVTATGTYHLYYGVGRIAVTLNTQACYP
jgi:hypothetical protein